MKILTLKNDAVEATSAYEIPSSITACSLLPEVYNVP